MSVWCARSGKAFLGNGHLRSEQSRGDGGKYSREGKLVCTGCIMGRCFAQPGAWKLDGGREARLGGGQGSDHPGPARPHEDSKEPLKAFKLGWDDMIESLL